MKSLSKRDYLVWGYDLILHPVTGEPIERGSGALSPNEQARRVHLKTIAQTRGPEAAADVERALTAFEQAGGSVELPNDPLINKPGIHQHLGR
jgi:hypothetical protein